jgi:hypothetical protein
MIVPQERLDRRVAQEDVTQLVSEYQNVQDGSFAIRAILLTMENNPMKANEILAMARSGLLRTIGNAPGAVVDVRLITDQSKDDAYVQVSNSGMQSAALALGTCGLEAKRLEELLVRRLKTEIEAVMLRSGADEQTRRTVIVDFVNGSKRTLAL